MGRSDSKRDIAKSRFFQWKRRILTYVFYTIPSNETYESNILYIYILRIFKAFFIWYNVKRREISTGLEGKFVSNKFIKTLRPYFWD